MLVNGVPSSFIDIGDPEFLAFEYMQQMACVLAREPGPLRVLHLGAGACSLACAVDAAHPGSRQLAIDIDDKLLQYVRQWFPLPRSPRLRLRSADAITEIRIIRPDSFDAVVRDVFAGDRTPEALCTLNYATAVRAVLRPGGVYLANCADRPPLQQARRELATLRQAFARDDGTAQLALIAETGILKGRRFGNLVLVVVKPDPDGSDDGWGLDSPALARSLRSLPTPAGIMTGAELDRFIGTASPIVG